MLMKRCVILSAAPVMNTRGLRQLVEEGDYIICADGGVKLAQRLGITPNLILGDFDSLDQVPDIAPVFTYEREKDDTDTMLAIKQGIAEGCDYFLLLGGLGGALDVFAGVVQRAPEIFSKVGMEWFYRLLKQPSRIGRMAKLPLFILHAVGSKEKGGHA